MAAEGSGGGKSHKVLTAFQGYCFKTDLYFHLRYCLNADLISPSMLSCHSFWCLLFAYCLARQQTLHNVTQVLFCTQRPMDSAAAIEADLYRSLLEGAAISMAAIVISAVMIYGI